VRDHILPDWWEDRLAEEPANRRHAELTISRALGIPLSQLVDPRAELKVLGTEVRFKRWRSTSQEKLLPAVAVARRTLEILLAGARDLPDLAFEGTEAAGLREDVLSRNDYVTLPALLERAWELGVPVVHLRNLPDGCKQLDGMALKIGSRPGIALASNKGAAWLIWHLAHELGHVAKGHLRTRDAIDEKIDFSSGQHDEREANEFAVSLLYGSLRDGFKVNRHLTGEQLAEAAQRIGRACRVLPASVVTSYGFNMKAWATANKALALLGEAEGGSESVNAFLHPHLDVDELPEADRRLLSAVTGLPE
jgi:hypothetical protein